MPNDPAADEVVLLDDRGEPVGTASRAEVHTTDTPLHLAFSCHLSGPEGQILLTRRALTKRTWPGVWTNAFCGHPRPGESLEEAVCRHARHELGLTVQDLTPVLPEFRYRAVDASGVVENELCPVFTARTDQEPVPNPEEVMELRWVHPADLRTTVATAPWALSPWVVAQVEQLESAGRWLGDGGGRS